MEAALNNPVGANAPLFANPNPNDNPEQIEAENDVVADNLLADPAPPEILDNANANNANNANANELNVGEDGQWNPIEWDRAAEELTWERLLGLDGSLVFLEHVFWVVSLNTLFILVFGKLIFKNVYFSQFFLTFAHNFNI